MIACVGLFCISSRPIVPGLDAGSHFPSIVRRHVLHTHRVADIFAQMNNKLGGDIEKIRTTGRYFVEIWKAIGMEGIGEKVPEATAVSINSRHSAWVNHNLQSRLQDEPFAMQTKIVQLLC